MFFQDLHLLLFSLAIRNKLLLNFFFLQSQLLQHLLLEHQLGFKFLLIAFSGPLKDFLKLLLLSEDLQLLNAYTKALPNVRVYVNLVDLDDFGTCGKYDDFVVFVHVDRVVEHVY
jgi:hypothetical protein